MVDNLAKAEEHLASLERICLIPCAEYEDLKRAIAATAGAPGRDRSIGHSYWRRC